MRKKTPLTRSLLAACSILALSAVMYGCVHDGGGDDPAPKTEAEPEPTPEPTPEPEPEEEEEEEEAEPEPEPEPDEQIAALQAQINALRAELGLEPIDIDELTDSVAELTEMVAALQADIDMRDEEMRMAEEAALAEAERDAGVLLFTGLDVAAENQLNVGAVTINADGTLTGDGTGATGVENVALEPISSGLLAELQGWKARAFALVPEEGVAGDLHASFVLTNDEGVTPTPFVDIYGTQVAEDTTDLGLDANPDLIASPEFASGAGTKEHEIPEGRDFVEIAGTYHGAAGTYRCTVGANAAAACTSEVAANGITLDGTDQTWTFTPNAGVNAMVADAAYLFFGYWTRLGGADGAFRADAFTGVFGDAAANADVAAASGLDDLNGSAEYVGPAVGVYALYQPITGPVRGGDWHATATLEADFTNDMISGMVDGFVTIDRYGEAREEDWTVSLSMDDVNATGVVAGDDDPTATGANTTTWTIGGTAGAADGRWDARLYNNGDDDVPQSGTGTFTATYGVDNNDNVGHMIGAFGVSRDD